MSDANVDEATRWLRVIGIQRSGNHAVIDWLLRNVPGVDSPVFLNDCVPSDSFKLRHNFAQLPGGERVTPEESSHEVAVAAALENCRLAIASFENKPLRVLFPDGDQVTLGGTAFSHNVVIVRDFFNWFASAIRLYSHPDLWHNITGLRLDVLMLTLCSRWFDYVSFACEPSDTTVLIDYGQWCDSPEYRADLLSVLGLPVLDNSRDVVADVVGSSFDGQSEKTASEMAVSERWQSLIGDEVAHGLLARCVRNERELQILTEWYGPEVLNERLRMLSLG